MEDAKLVSYTEAAEFLGVRRSTVYGWVSQGILPHYRMGKRAVRFSLTELRVFRLQAHVPAKVEGTGLTLVGNEGPADHD